MSVFASFPAYPRRNNALSGIGLGANRSKFAKNVVFTEEFRPALSQPHQPSMDSVIQQSDAKRILDSWRFAEESPGRSGDEDQAFVRLPTTRQTSI
jgi:hypothetical protein